jgi:mono/diheme cytochrome c family protein
MRRLVLLAVPLVALAAGCGGGTAVKPVPATVVGSLPKTTTSAPAPKLPKGNAQAGKAVFTSAGCSGCHTLKAAGATGTVGPNLDQVSPSLDKIETQVINGGGPMPPFKGQLTDQQIADVAQFVYQAEHGG